MSTTAVSAVWKHSRSAGTPRFVLVALADEANDEGLVTAHRRSHSHVAGKCAVSPDTVARAVRTLTALGELEVLKVGSGRQQSDYRIVLPGLGEGVQSAASPKTERPRPRGGRVRVPAGADPAPVLPPSSRSYPASNPKGLEPLSANADVAAVFDAWRSATGKTRARLDPKRERLITARLRDYPVDDLVIAVNGWKFSPHHRGENERGTVYNDLELLLRDAAHVERFRDLALDGPSLVPVGGHRPSNVQRGLAALAAPNPWEDLFDGQEDAGPIASRANGQLPPAPDGGP